MELVNGYPCFNCTDVDLAKKGINPAKPQDDPRSPNYDPASAKAADGSSSNRDSAAVTFGGSLTALNGAQSPGKDGSNASDSSQQQPQPQSQYRQPGSTLDISV